MCDEFFDYFSDLTFFTLINSERVEKDWVIWEADCNFFQSDTCRCNVQVSFMNLLSTCCNFLEKDEIYLSVGKNLIVDFAD